MRRLTLFLIPILTLSIPFIFLPLQGLRSIGDIENEMVSDLEGSLSQIAQTLADKISEQIEPELNKEPVQEEQTQKPDLARLSGTMLLDGFNNDWPPEVVSPRFNDRNDPESIGYRYYSGLQGQYLYLLFEVQDDNVIYRDTDTLRLDQSDHLQIIVLNEDRQKKYIAAGYKPGWIVGFEIPDTPDQIAKIEKRIHGVWKSTNQGYTLELRLERDLLGEDFSLAIADVDDKESRSIKALINASGTVRDENREVSLSDIIDLPSLLNESDLNLLTHRVRIIDSNLQILAEYGKTAGLSDSQSTMGAAENTTQKVSDISGIQYALNGQEMTVHYQSPDTPGDITAAIAPIRNNDKVVALLLVEQNVSSVLSPIKNTIKETILLCIITFLISSCGICLYLFLLSRTGRNEPALPAQ